MATFQRTLGELFERVDPAVGARRRLRRGDPHPPVGDRAAGDARRRLRPRGPRAAGASGSSARAPNLEYRILRAQEPFPFADGEFALATAIEVLEHVPDPEHTVAEMARCARGGHLLVSVPREPLWRGLNMARGAYLKDLGNTPGHVNHWSKRSFAELLSRHGEVVEARSPFPWTMLLAARRNVAEGEREERAARLAGESSIRRASRLRARRADPLGRHRDDRRSSRSRTSRSRRTSSTTPSTRRSRCCGRCCSSPSR